MDSLKEYLKKRRDLINRKLDELLPKADLPPQTLHRAIRYSVFSGGKRIRPIIAIEACRLCGGQLSDAIKAACAIEMVHTYSLIHDDLPSMDNDDYRRGKPACHKKFGEATAILAGDALLTQAFRVLAKSERTDRLDKAIIGLSKNIGSLGMVGGQEVDLREKTFLSKYRGRASAPRLDFIAENKTASLFRASMMVGAIFGEANNRQERTLSEFGRLLGIAFQLMDDYFDNDGYVRIIGKEKTRKKALESIDRAKKRLRPFGRKADRLKELADFVARSEATKQSRKA